MKRIFAAILVFAMAFALALPALAASGWDKPEPKPGDYEDFVLSAEKYEYYASASSGYPADGRYFARWDDKKGIVKDTLGRVHFQVTLPSYDDAKALYPNVMFEYIMLTVTYTITNVKAVAEVDLLAGDVNYYPEPIPLDPADKNVFSVSFPVWLEDKPVDIEAMFVFAAASDKEVVASVEVSLKTGLWNMMQPMLAIGPDLNPLYIYQSKVLVAAYTFADLTEFGEYMFMGQYLVMGEEPYALIFDVDDNDKIQRIFLGSLFSFLEETPPYQVFLDANGRIAFKALGASVQEGDDDYADLKEMYDFFMGSLGFKWDGTTKYMNEELIIANLLPKFSNKATVVFPAGYPAVVNPSVAPPQTGDASTAVGFAMIVLALVAAAVVTVKKVRA